MHCTAIQLSDSTTLFIMYYSIVRSSVAQSGTATKPAKPSRAQPPAAAAAEGADQVKYHDSIRIHFRTFNKNRRRRRILLLQTLPNSSHLVLLLFSWFVLLLVLGEEPWNEYFYQPLLFLFGPLLINVFSFSLVPSFLVAPPSCIRVVVRQRNDVCGPPLVKLSNF